MTQAGANPPAIPARIPSTALFCFSMVTSLNTSLTDRCIQAIPWGMQLPVNPPVLPMLAKRVGELPAGDTWVFEPKWDGFRSLVFRDGDDILVQSRDQKSLNRYFPELVEALRARLPERCVLDGEIVIAAER